MNPDERPSPYEFGRLEGKVDETIRRVGNVEEAITDMGRTSTAEHAEVGRKLDELGREFRQSLEARDHRIDSLESTRDKGSGAAKLIEVGKGLVVLVLLVATYFASKGGV
jgi:hypothetical protein